MVRISYFHNLHEYIKNSRSTYYQALVQAVMTGSLITLESERTGDDERLSVVVVLLFSLSGGLTGDWSDCRGGVQLEHHNQCII